VFLRLPSLPVSAGKEGYELRALVQLFNTVIDLDSKRDSTRFHR
jgi:hypothetical protein